MSNQTAMQQLLNQIRLESGMDHIYPKEWAMCLKCIQMLIQHTYLEIEEKQIEEAWTNGMKSDNGHFATFKQYYKETYNNKQ